MGFTNKKYGAKYNLNAMVLVCLLVRQPHKSCTQHQHGQRIVGQRPTRIKGIANPERREKIDGGK
ncbi:MAG: hypothetical protein IPJ20_07095 [Flammeovirgaceae bacterium]|nr:hypothetical protein [Flammeovirgaceae bacterium]